MAEPSRSHFALVLPGAVAKGAYEAGVIQVLAEQDLRIDRIVATSSGALNGIAYAAGIRSGNEKEMAAKLVKMWIEKGGFLNSLKLSPLDLLRGRGISNRAGLMNLLNEVVQPCTHSQKREVELRIIISPLRGIQGSIGKTPATTYEKIIKFTGEDFDTAERLAKVFEVVTAACAFPGLFAPVEIDGLGPCVDGGTVNNAPIAYALDESDVSRVIVPVPFTAVMPEVGDLSGFNLLNHLIEVLINERLYRDLKEAHIINHEVARLEGLVSDGTITAQQLVTLQKVLMIRKVQITEVRPVRGLSGTAFSGFFSKSDRIQLVADGHLAAREAFSRDSEESDSPGPSLKA